VFINKGNMLENTRTLEREMETTPRGEGDWRHWVQERIQRLPFRLRRDAAPELALGTRVLVVKGEVRNDLGQMAIVSRHAGSQVEIAYRSPTGLWKTRRKLPTSLLRMEEGIEMAIDDNGWPVIRRMTEQDDESLEENRGVVSEDDEARAQ
jgi:hypothetical protein